MPLVGSTGGNPCSVLRRVVGFDVRFNGNEPKRFMNRIGLVVRGVRSDSYPKEDPATHLCRHRTVAVADFTPTDPRMGIRATVKALYRLGQEGANHGRPLGSFP